MDVLDVVTQMTRVDVAFADLTGVRDDLARVAKVRSWLDAREIADRRRLEDFRDPFGATPDQELARAGNTSRSAADNVNTRSRTCTEVPQLGDALADGAVTGTHLDLFDRGIRGLGSEERRKLIDEEGERLARLARRQSPDEFARTVRETVAASRSDGGVANLNRQKRAARLKAWTDQATGMVHLNGQFDPESGMKLIGRLRSVVENLFHDRVPDTCPSDPLEKQDHLRALALIAIVDGTAAPGGRPDLIVVVDEETLRRGVHDHSMIDLGVDTVLPVETLRRMACIANIIPAVLNSDGVVVDLGRSARLATRAQRRAMRAMYASCGISGCRVPFEQCVLHHIHYWEDGGKTDMANMIPLCSKHHHAAHEGGWHLSLDAVTRELTITFPDDGSIRTTGPPRARAG